MTDKNTLKEQFLQAMFRFRKMGTVFHKQSDVSMKEFIMMENIAGNSSCPNKNFNFTEVKSNLHITQAAVSQMLNSLENKGYITRDIDRTNRRKITVALTEKGEKTLKRTKEDFEKKMDMVFARYGEDNTKQLIKLLDLLSDTADEIKAKNFTEGDDTF